jgi:hypothetical protein
MQMDVGLRDAANELLRYRVSHVAVSVG